MLKINNRFHTAVLNGSFFSLNQWDFEVSEMRRLVKAVGKAQDGHHFNIDMTNFDWKNGLKNFVLGIRQYILKDDLNSLPLARRKLQRYDVAKVSEQIIYYVIFRLFWFQQVVIIFFVIISINLILKLYQFVFQ